MKRLAIIAVAAILPAGVAAAKADLSVELRSTAVCTMEQGPKQVLALLQTLPGSGDEVRAAARVAPVYNICSGNSIALGISNAPHNLHNGRANLAAAAAAALLDKNAAVPQAGASLWYASAIAGKAPNRDYDAAALGGQEFGTCVFNAAPQASAALVRSGVGSAEERQSLAAIKPVLAGCLVQGAPVHLKIDQLRLMIAEPLYHVLADGPSAAKRQS